jgi:hypothetical protein
MVRRERHDKWRTKSWLILHVNAPAHRSVLVKNFLAKNNVTTLEHPSDYSDLAAADFYLFPRLNAAMERRRFRDVINIDKNATERFSKNWLPGKFSTPLQSLAEVHSDTRGLL